MLDNLLIIFTLLFVVIQLIISCCLFLTIARSKKAGGIVVSSFWSNSVPCLLLIFTTTMLACAIKTGDKIILMIPILLSMCLLFDMHVFYYDGEKMNYYCFLFHKNVCNSLSVNEKVVVADLGKKKQIVRLSNRKLETLTPYLKVNQ